MPCHVSRRLFFSFFWIISLGAMQQVEHIKNPEEKLTELTMRLQAGVAYNTLIDELQHDHSIGHLFDCAITQSLVALKNPLFHVLAQAYIRSMLVHVTRGEHMFSSLEGLCMYVERRYKQVAASLKLYLYCALPRAEREAHNISLLKYMDVEAFLRQLPDDMRVVQFAEVDEFSSNFAVSGDMDHAAIMLLAERFGYMPFMYYYRRAVARMNRIIFDDGGWNDLGYAIIFQDVIRIKELLDRGVSVLQTPCGSNISLLESALRLCPTSSAVPYELASFDRETYYVTYIPDLLHDEICRMLLEQALQEDEDNLLELLHSSPALRMRAESLIPDLAIK